MHNQCKTAGPRMDSVRSLTQPKRQDGKKTASLDASNEVSKWAIANKALAKTAATLSLVLNNLISAEVNSFSRV